MDTLKFNEDYYAITYLTYHYLDLQTAHSNTQSLIIADVSAGEKEEEDLGPVISQMEAAKNFSNCVFVFLIQNFLLYLVFAEFNQGDF